MDQLLEIEIKTKALIDHLKTVCANFGLGNDGNEFKIIVQCFIYKYIVDQYLGEMTGMMGLGSASECEARLRELSSEEIESLHRRLPPGCARLGKGELLSELYSEMNLPRFAMKVDRTFERIASRNLDVFSVETVGGSKIQLFEPISQYVLNEDQRDGFCRALISRLISAPLNHLGAGRFDFFSTIFEYMIEDYNKDGGGTYAEYYTPQKVARTMARILVGNSHLTSVACYDPSAGSGTLLMNLAHVIGVGKCSIYSQDLSQKSTTLLRANLVLNELVSSIGNIVNGNTLTFPAHTAKAFDLIVSNPPFKLDFSADRTALSGDTHRARFFAGVPTVPKKKPEGMAIYLLFIQHILYSLKDNGRAAIVVPTGFLTSSDSIEMKIKSHLVETNRLRGILAMPSNIFANTGTNVSIIFIGHADDEKVLLVDATGCGVTAKEGKNKKTYLTQLDEDKIVSTFLEMRESESFSVLVSLEEIASKGMVLSPGHYFKVALNLPHDSAAGARAELNSIITSIEGLVEEDIAQGQQLMEVLRSLKNEVAE
ncbi:MAG: class I SAM-dependent DNA methyltransferase [Armatimonadota bacterium]